MPDFKVGDVVMLKSGGPSLTVCGRDINGVECMWFSNDGVIQNELFPPKVLEHSIDDDEGFYEEDYEADDDDEFEEMTDAELDALVADAERNYSDRHGH